MTNDQRKGGVSIDYSHSDAIRTRFYFVFFLLVSFVLDDF